MARQKLYVSKDQDGCITVLPSDCTVYGQGGAPGRRFGKVITSELTHRQTLWRKPGEDSAELGQYYSGMQAEILGEEGAFWTVLLGEKEGYQTKKALREVLAWEGKPEYTTQHQQREMAKPPHDAGIVKWMNLDEICRLIRYYIECKNNDRNHTAKFFTHNQS